MRSTCAVVGKPEFYGVGIRASFYLLWFGMTLARWIWDPTLFLLLLSTHFIFASGVFVGLVISLATLTVLSAAEVYVLLLLVSAFSCYVRLPYYIWRVATIFRPDLDCGFYYHHLGFRDRGDMAGPYVFGVAETGLLMSLIGTHLWLWSSGVDSNALYANGRAADGSVCELQKQVGFAFKPGDLASTGFRAFNAVIIFAVAGGTVVTALADAGWIASEAESRSRRRRRRRRERRKMRDARLELLRKLQTTCDMTVTPIIVSAVELTIYWNDIPNVNTANTTAQLIPLFLSLVLTTMVVVQLGLIIAGLSPNDSCRYQEEGNEQEEVSIHYTSRPIFSSAIPITPSSTASPIVPDPVTLGSVATSDSSPSEGPDGPSVPDPTHHSRDPPCSYT
ncbi:hypothetical protein QBC34DRAFT_194351 [Podospora aff. communis PSN243]|uniref:Uncharacterized protein n=1 Tax=Podospora aff. communis PSN243 TaxID=3040156 RepID=A0AAV9GYN9_9PEZI|nr:hypothetical protein QBC34DRAFT_194351 [Podospora aff. communis PSN243]